MEEIYFSMIVYVDDESGLKKSIKSILSSSRLTQKETKIIVVDPICSDYTIEICYTYQKKIGKNNFQYIKTFGMSMADAYNVAIHEIKGRYVNFSCSSMHFSANAIEMIRVVSEKEGRPKIITVVPWTENEKNEKVQYLMSPQRDNDLYTDIIRLKRQPQDVNLMLHSYFIRCYLVNSKERHMWFNEKIEDDSAVEFVLRLIIEFPNNLLLPKQSVYYKFQLEDNFSACRSQQCEWWYMDSFDTWMIPYLKRAKETMGVLPKYIKAAFFYLLYVKYRANMNYLDKKVLNKNQVKEFYLKTSQLLQFIDNRMIFSKSVFKNLTIPRRLRIWFLELKAQGVGKQCDPIIWGNKLCLWTHEIFKFDELIKQIAVDSMDQKMIIDMNLNDQIMLPKVVEIEENETLINLCELEKEHVVLQAINYRNGNLEIDGILSLGNFLPPEKIKLYAIIEGRMIQASYIEIYGFNKVFGEIYERKYMFHVPIYVPVYNDKISEIKFVVQINENLVEIEIRTGKPYTHIQSGIKGQYWNFYDTWSMNLVRKTILRLKKDTPRQLEDREKKYQQQLDILAKENENVQRALDIRKEYFSIKQECAGKRIWITFDKLYKAGDNGEYIFHYIDENVEDIDIFYLINDDAPDYERLKDNAHVLVWGKDETIALVLHAEAILTTHGDIAQYVGLNSDIAPYLCDLMNSYNVCIQHGLTVQDIAKFQNRLFTNLHLYMCASSYEIRNLSRPIFGYDEEQLKLVGLARYDGLRNADKRQILITPSWRRNITNTNIVHATNMYNINFKKSDYFRIYNDLINDEKLIRFAKKNKYKIIYLIHPALSAQIDDFDKNEYVNIIAATSDMSYEKILTESSLMVTDYSGVQFDFAYMRKPLLYYHPEELPPHYDESIGYSYEKDAFGPLIHTHENIVNQLCEYMENNCKMKSEYVERANRFFAFDDFNNCARIFNAINDYIEEDKKG